MTALVTGAAGFIGAALARQLAAAGTRIVAYDAMTYAGSLPRLAGIPHRFVQADVRDRHLLAKVLSEEQVVSVYHLAAESHVDRSIDGPRVVVDTNVMGTLAVAEAALGHWRALPPAAADGFRLVIVSTDEVFGSLGEAGAFTETSPIQPNSPYAASKAAADHIALSFHRTWGLPVLVSHGVNTFGPWQFPEKLIPLMIANALDGRELPVYGDGLHVRSWLHVDDHAAALARIAAAGRPGERYGIGGVAAWTNLDLVRALAALLDATAPSGAPHARLIRHVADRPGHDRRYATDDAKLRRETGWSPARSFEAALAETVDWYLGHRDWWQDIRARVYDGWRLGTG